MLRGVGDAYNSYDIRHPRMRTWDIDCRNLDATALGRWSNSHLWSFMHCFLFLRSKGQLLAMNRQILKLFWLSLESGWFRSGTTWNNALDNSAAASSEVKTCQMIWTGCSSRRVKKTWHAWFVIHCSMFIRHYYISLHPCVFSERFHHFWMVFAIIVKVYTCRQILMVLVPWTSPPSLPSPLEARTSGVETCPRNVVSVNQHVLFLTLSSIFYCLMEFRGVCGSKFLVWGQDLVFNVKNHYFSPGSCEKPLTLVFY